MATMETKQRRAYLGMRIDGKGQRVHTYVNVNENNEQVGSPFWYPKIMFKGFDRPGAIYEIVFEVVDGVWKSYFTGGNKQPLYIGLWPDLSERQDWLAKHEAAQNEWAARQAERKEVNSTKLGGTTLNQLRTPY